MCRLLKLLLGNGMLWVAAVFSIGQAATPKDGASADSDFFENRIRPILVERCYQCHSAEKKQSKGGLKLDSRDDVLKGGHGGPAVIPGRPEGSLLIRAIRRTDKDLKMPPAADDALTPAQVQDFVAWVKLGLPFPGPAGAPSPDVHPSLDLVKARQFWSFRPLKDPPLPKVKQPDWPQDSIDRF